MLHKTTWSIFHHTRTVTVSGWYLEIVHLLRKQHHQLHTICFVLFKLFFPMILENNPRLTVDDDFYFLHVWKGHIIFCTAFIFASLVPCNCVDVQILSTVKWFCYPKKERKKKERNSMLNCSCLRLHSSKTTIVWVLTRYCWQNNSRWNWGIIKVFVLVCSQENSKTKKQKQNKLYYNNHFPRAGYTCAPFNWLWSSNLFTHQIEFCTFL